MRKVISDASLVAYCGLYCGACRAYLKGHCPGCGKNEKATWCKIRICCKGNNFKTCADCLNFTDVNECTKFNNIISKVFAFVFRSNRKACIEQIKNNGIEKHAAIMADKKAHSLKRN